MATQQCTESLLVVIEAGRAEDDDALGCAVMASASPPTPDVNHPRIVYLRTRVRSTVGIHCLAGDSSGVCPGVTGRCIAGLCR